MLLPEKHGKGTMTAVLPLLYAAAAISPFSIALGHLFWFLLLVVVSWIYFSSRDKRTFSPLFLSVVICSGYVVLSTIASAYAQDQGHMVLWKEAIRWVRAGPFAVLVVALALLVSNNWRKAWLYALTITVIATITEWLITADTQEFFAALEGKGRYTSEVQPFIGSLKTGAIGLLLIGAVLYLPPQTRGRSAFYIVIAAGLGFLATATVAMGSRGLWIGAIASALVLVILSVVDFWSLRAKRPSQCKSSLPGLVIVLTMLVATFLALQGPIEKRWEHRGAEDQLITVITDDWGEWEEKLERESVGIRALLFKAGMEAFLQRPFFGYGPFGLEEIKRGAARPHVLPQNISHFHNFFIEYGLRFGGLGILAFLFPVAIGIKATAQNTKKDRLDLMIRSLMISCLVLMLFYAVTDPYLERFKAYSFYSILFAPLFIYALEEGSVWKPSRKREE